VIGDVRERTLHYSDTRDRMMINPVVPCSLVPRRPDLFNAPGDEASAMDIDCCFFVASALFHFFSKSTLVLNKLFAELMYFAE
jgi:hypothetical protein